jgi:hypothetical protein
MAVPRPISGSAGSRIRVIFNSTGEQWLLLLDEDDGDRKWQSKHWEGGIPGAIAQQLNNCTDKGRRANEVDFGPTGAWFVNGIKHDGSGGHSWWGGTDGSTEIKEWTSKPHELKVSFGTDLAGRETRALVQGNNGHWSTGIDPDLHSRLERIRNRRKAIGFVRLFNEGAYFVSDDEGTEWKGLGEHCNKELEGQGGKVHDVAKSEDGTWLVIRANGFTPSQGVPASLQKHLAAFYREHRARVNRRAQQIGDHERAARERAAREAREREECEARERERVQREAQEQVERERAQRDAELAVAAAARSAQASSASEVALRRKLDEERESICELEAHVQRRKRSLAASCADLPPALRARYEQQSTHAGGGGAAAAAQSTSAPDRVCVVCQDRDLARAVVPCGHLCLCNTCAATIESGGARQCPLCRGPVQGTMRIFSQ